MIMNNNETKDFHAGEMINLGLFIWFYYMVVGSEGSSSGIVGSCRATVVAKFLSTELEQRFS